MRGVAKNWSIEIRENQELRSEIEEKVPSHSLIRQWLGKIRLYELQRAKEKRDDWIWIIDFTIELGTEKCYYAELKKIVKPVQESQELINFAKKFKSI